MLGFAGDVEGDMQGLTRGRCQCQASKEIAGECQVCYSCHEIRVLH